MCTRDRPARAPSRARKPSSGASRVSIRNRTPPRRRAVAPRPVVPDEPAATRTAIAAKGDHEGRPPPSDAARARRAAAGSPRTISADRPPPWMAAVAIAELWRDVFPGYNCKVADTMMRIECSLYGHARRVSAGSCRKSCKPAFFAGACASEAIVARRPVPSPDASARHGPVGPDAPQPRPRRHTPPDPPELPRRAGSHGSFTLPGRDPLPDFERFA